MGKVASLGSALRTSRPPADTTYRTRGKPGWQPHPHRPGLLAGALLACLKDAIERGLRRAAEL